jgi:transposase-like protein
MCMRQCCADRRWVREFGTDGRDAFPGKGQLKPDAEELRSLKREVVKLKAERDILKKAAVPTSPGIICDVWICSDAPRDLAGKLDV